MLRESKILSKEKGFSILELGRERALEMTDFVYETYYSRFHDRYGVLTESDHESMRREDRFTLNSSVIYAALSDCGTYLGCMRITRRRGRPLPAEREFEFDAVEEIKRNFPDRPSIGRISEVGRFATSFKNLVLCKLPKSYSILITDLLLRCMFDYATPGSNSYGVASLDVTTLRILRMRGMQITVIGEARDYLGSPTVPALLCTDYCLEEMSRERPEQFAFMTGRDRATLQKATA